MLILSIKAKGGDTVISRVFSFDVEFDRRTNTNTIWYKQSDSPYAANISIRNVLSYAYYAENGVLIKEETLCEISNEELKDEK
jgi:hypothetical protein